MNHVVAGQPNHLHRGEKRWVVDKLFENNLVADNVVVPADYTHAILVTFLKLPLLESLEKSFQGSV